MTLPSFVHRFRPITNRELGLLIAHFRNSGTSFNALMKFTEAVVARKGWEKGPWVIPLPGDSTLFYVIGDPPSSMKRIPTQQEIQWQEPHGRGPLK